MYRVHRAVPCTRLWHFTVEPSSGHLISTTPFMVELWRVPRGEPSKGETDRTGPPSGPRRLRILLMRSRHHLDHGDRGRPRPDHPASSMPAVNARSYHLRAWVEGEHPSRKPADTASQERGGAPSWSWCLPRALTSAGVAPGIYATTESRRTPRDPGGVQPHERDDR